MRFGADERDRSLPSVLAQQSGARTACVAGAGDHDTQRRFTHACRLVAGVLIRKDPRTRLALNGGPIAKDLSFAPDF